MYLIRWSYRHVGVSITMNQCLMCGVCTLWSKEKPVFIHSVPTHLHHLLWHHQMLILFIKPCTMPCAWGKKPIMLPLNCSKCSSEGFHIMIQFYYQPYLASSPGHSRVFNVTRRNLPRPQATPAFSMLHAEKFLRAILKTREWPGDEAKPYHLSQNRWLCMCKMSSIAMRW